MKNFTLFLLISAFTFSCKKSNKALFTSLSAEQSGIAFNNTITENDTLNALAFEYVYNGGGVAMGDFNNDNKIDVYFTGNQVANKLYLNKGAQNSQLTFADITTQSKTEGEGKWCAGATVVDINNDNLLDIYVSASVYKSAKMRENILYINQGFGKDSVPVFKNMAKEYGIADTTHTTHAAFFDYDNDGDLDLYLLVNEMEKIRFPNKYVKKQLDGTSRRTDRLYRNDGPIEKAGGGFKNVSAAAGIKIEGYGLGLNICDINNDGWKDIYVANDYLSNDIFYVNNKNGTFTDKAFQYFKHTSYSAMGCDVQDLNNDGMADIFTADMLPADNYRKKMMLPANNYFVYQNNEIYEYLYQYTRNTLQANRGINPKTKEPIFSEIGIQAGVAATDWSWGPMVTDFDNDGLRDMIITNGYPKDITDQDFVAYRHESKGRFTLKQLYDSIPVVKKTNYAFKNKGDFQFEDVSAQWNVSQPSFSNGAAYADLDNDGDLDYITNNINDNASVFINNSQQNTPEASNYLRIKLVGNSLNVNAIGAKLEVNYGAGQSQVYENTPYRGYLSTVENVVHFGLGNQAKVATVNVIWPSGKTSTLKNVKANQILSINETSATIGQSSENILANTLLNDVTGSLGFEYIDKETDYVDYNFEKLLPHKLSEYGPALAVGDVNNDGLEDVFVGGSSNHKGKFLLQNKLGKYQVSDLILSEKDTTKLSEDAGALLFDADGDGDLDLYIVSGSNEYYPLHPAYQDRLYQNNGKGQFLQNKAAIPAILKSGSCIKAADFDHDGDLDLLVGGRSKPQTYPSPVSSYLFRNDSKPGQILFKNVSKELCPALENIGMVTDGIFTDYDNDGWQDIILVGEGMPITILQNKQGKAFTKIASNVLDAEVGFWNSITAGDFDNDGDTDYVVGNTGQNYFMKATNERPVTLYGKDFNQDGTYDAIPTVHYKDEKGTYNEVSYHGRDDLIKQMTIIRAKYTNYKSFANTTINKILWEGDLLDAIKIKVNNTNTSYIQNLGKQQFAIQALPWQAQVGPVFGMLAQDFDADGNLDLLLQGNDFGNEVSVGRLDAHNGLYLKGLGNGSFEPLLSQQAGFYVPGSAKALVFTKNIALGNMIFASQNRAELKQFSIAAQPKSMTFKSSDSHAILTLSNGKKQKIEQYFGSSFYSQSSAVHLLVKNVKNVEVFGVNNK